MKSILTVCLLVGLLSCKKEDFPAPGIMPVDFVGAYQFSGTITNSEATEGYLLSPKVTMSGSVSGQLLITTFGTGTAIQVLETSDAAEVNKRYQAAPATQKMVALNPATSYAGDMTGSLYLINDKEISITRTTTRKVGHTYYSTEVSLRGVKIKS